MNFTRKVKRDRTLIVAALVLTVLGVLTNQLFLETAHESKQAIARASESTMCQPEQPCSYDDTVDLRIIVMTYKRPVSLAKLLQSLVDLEMDNSSASLEIWIDKNETTGSADEQTVKVASEFRWRGGPTRVHIHSQHVGIYGQWIDTWRPRDDSDDELALFLEDDVSVSKYAYRWVRAAFHAYGNRSDFAGVSLTSNKMTILSKRKKGRLAGPKHHTAMMYKCFGSWGFAPKPLHWRRFQAHFPHSGTFQYHVSLSSNNTQNLTMSTVAHCPLVWAQPEVFNTSPGQKIKSSSLPTKWYQHFEKSGQSKSMWSMWFIYYMHINRLYAVYSNLRVYTGNSQSSLTTNRLEVGLHQNRKGSESLGELLTTWKQGFVQFPKDPVRLNWDGSHVPKNQRF